MHKKSYELKIYTMKGIIIDISENTHGIIKDAYDCEFREKLKVKNRGTMNMYFVNRKPELTT